MTDAYGIGSGQTRGYGPGMIHSTEHPEKCWVIRITGTDLDVLAALQVPEVPRPDHRKGGLSRLPVVSAKPERPFRH